MKQHSFKERNFLRLPQLDILVFNFGSSRVSVRIVSSLAARVALSLDPRDKGCAWGAVCALAPKRGITSLLSYLSSYLSVCLSACPSPFLLCFSLRILLLHLPQAPFGIAAIAHQVRLAVQLLPPPSAPADVQDVQLTVIYELYDGMPLMSKWITVSANPK